MTRIAPVALVALVALLTACSRQPPPPPPHPIAVAAESSFDFGTLWIGEVRQKVFHVENRGGKPLVFDPIRSSCGCLIARIEPKRLEAGASGELTAELHADKGPTRLEKGIFVGTNDPDHEWLSFALIATTRTLYDCKPPLLDLPELVLGDSSDHSISVTVADGSPVKFGAPQTPERGFSTTVTDSTPTSATLRIRFDGVTLPGRRLFHVVVPTDHPLVNELRMPVQAIVLPRLVANPPDRIDFGDVVRRDGATREVVIRRRSQSRFAVPPTVRVEVDRKRSADDDEPPLVTAELVERVSGDEWVLVIAVAPGSPGRGLVGRVVVRLALENEPPLSLTLTGRFTEPR